ncbi:MAG TPA: hypothetical protein VHO03_16625 [Ignavibacteriales bacterium]|nr:hypothetical protein [Ignavibacteriales bacterium]
MIKVYGSSDDLVEIEGDIVEEFSHYGDESCLLAFDNGVILECRYEDDGIWRFRVKSQGNTTVNVIPPDLTKDEYSETVVIDAPVKVVAFGTNAQFYIKKS